MPDPSLLRAARAIVVTTAIKFAYEFAVSAARCKYPRIAGESGNGAGCHCHNQKEKGKQQLFDFHSDPPFAELSGHDSEVVNNPVLPLTCK